MNDDAVVKVISRLTVDISLAKTNLEELAKETGLTTKQIKKYAKEIEQCYRELAKAQDAEGTRIKQEEAMWRQLQRQKEAEARAEERRMRQEIRMWEQQEAAQQRSLERQRRAEEQAARAAERERQRAAKEAERAAKAAERAAKLAAQEEARKARLLAQEQKRAAIEAARAQREQQASTIGLANLSAQSAMLQSRVKLENISSVTLRAQVAEHAKAVDALRQKVALEGRLTTEHKQQLQQLQMQQKILSAQVSEASALQRATISGQLTSMAARRLSWFATGALVFGTTAGLRQIINDVADVEMRMIALARVLEDPLFTVEKMRTELFGLAQEFGFTFAEVSDIALRWAQAGYDMAESLELTRASLLALNTAELNVEEATQALIGVMAQWGFQANQLISVIDKINAVSDEYAVTSQDLVDGLLRASGAARAAGMTFEQTVALITAMREASGRTGKEVGNALNSIIAYIQRAKSLEVLSEAGIPVFADPERTRLRSVFDILADISAKWQEMEKRGLTQVLLEEAEAAGLFTEEIAEATGALEEWSDLQRRDILQAGAGVYRRNYLLALLNNFTQVYDVLNTQERALGYSQRENERTMQAYTKQVASLKAEFQELAYALAAEGGPLDFLKMLVAWLREGVDWFNKLPQSVKNTIMALAAISLTIGTLNAATRYFTGKGLPEMVRELGGLSGILASLRTTVANLITSLGGLGPAALKLAPVLAVIGGIAYALYEVNKQAYDLQNNFTKLQEEFETTARSLDAEVKIHRENAKQVAALAAEYRELMVEYDRLKEQREEEPQEVALRMREIIYELETAIGKEETLRLRAAGMAEEAVQRIIDAENAKADAATEALERHTRAYKEAVANQINDTLRLLAAIEAQSEGWTNNLTLTERITVAWGNTIIKVYEALADTVEWFYRLAERIYTWLAEKLRGFAEATRDSAVGRFIQQIPGLREAAEWAASTADALSKGAEKYAEAAGVYQEKAPEIARAMLAGLSAGWGAPGGPVLTPEGAEAAIDSVAERAKQRLRKHLADLQEELARFSLTSGAGSGWSPGEGYGTASEEAEKLVNQIRSVVDAIVAEVEAIGLLDKAIERHMNILEERIAYYTREGASLEELQQADRDRAELMDLLRQRQEMLHRQAEAARQAYADLEQQIRSTFGQVFDLSTPEGRAGYFALSDEQRQAYDALADAMERMLDVAAQNGAEWWRIQRQLNELAQENNAVSVVTLRILEETQKQYKEGAITLEDYARVLKVLSDQADLSAEALKALREAEREVKQERFDTALANLEDLYESGYIDLRQYIEGLRGLRDEAMFSKDAMERLNGELEKAIREYLSGQVEAAFTERIEAIEAEIEKVNDELKRTVEHLDQIFEGFDRVTRQMERAAVRTNLVNAYNAFIGRPTRYSEPSAASIRNLAREAISGFGLSDLSALGVLSPEEFEEAISRDLDILRGASTKAKRLADQVSGYYSQRLREIEQELKAVDEWYEARIAELQRQLDALDAEEKAAERAKAEEEYNKRIQALMEEREWVLLQNEEDAAFRLAAIDAQLAKERAAWSEQLTKWQREDQRERIRNEMEELQRRRDAIRRDLEEQREALREQQQMMSDLLNAVLEYINSEIEARREATEDYKAQLQAQAEARVQDLEDTKAWLEEKRAAFDEHWANVLADMAARDPEFFARGQALVDNIIAGIESRKADLEAAIDELNSILSRVRSGVSIDLPSLTVGGGTVYGMAEGAYVRGGKGGVLALIGEKAHDEIVMPVPKLTPTIAEAMRKVISTDDNVLTTLPNAIASAVRQALANTSFYGAFDITLPDGTVERKVIQVFSGLTPHVRTT